MAKIVKTVIEVGVGIGLMALSGGLAGIGIAGVMSAGTLATAVTGLGLGLALMGTETLVTKTPSFSNSLSDRLSMNYDTTAPRAIVFGTTAADTALRFKETYGKDNDRLALVIANASHRLSAVKAIYLDSVLSYSGGLTGKYSSGIERLQPVLEGTATNGSATGTGAYWTSRSTFTGCAYTFLTYKLDKNKVWTDGLPQKITTVVNGCPLYDPRRDSTNGGSGSIRPDDQSTWAFTVGGVDIGRNPALALLTYIIGYRINGILAWGMGVSLDRINIQNFIEYANVCEERVQTVGGGTTQRYTCDGIFSTNDTHETVINTICASMGTALLIDLDGLYQFVGGFDDTLTTPMAFTADDVMSGGVWSPSPAVRDRFNIISGRFADPAQLYELDDWGSIEVDPLFDNVPRTQTVDLGCVDRAETCQRIAKQMLVREKYSGTYTAVFGPRAFGVSVGSLLTLSLPQFGWEEKLFRVTDQSESYELLYQMTLREESPEIYAWDANEGKPLPTTELTDIYDPIVAADVTNLAIDARSVNGTNSVSTIFIDVAWMPSASLRVASIEIQSQVPGDTDWTTQTERWEDIGTFSFAAGVNGAAINVRARYRMSNGATGDWSNASLSSTPTSTVNQWSSIYDNGDGTKPQDGATKGAPSGTDVGGVPADDVAGAITDGQGNVVKVIDVQSQVDDAKSNIASLLATYGDTASAAASASVAQSNAELTATYQAGAQNALAATFPNSFDPAGRAAFTCHASGSFQGPNASWPEPYLFSTRALTGEQQIFNLQPVPKKAGARYRVHGYYWTNDTSGQVIAGGIYEQTMGPLSYLNNMSKGSWQLVQAEWNSDDFPSATDFRPYMYWKSISGANANGSFYVIGPFVEDVTQTSSAAAQVTIATNQAALAAASAAAAQSNAVLSASLSGGSINKNSTFADFAAGLPNSGGCPPSWHSWTGNGIRAYGNGDTGVDGPHIEGSPWAFYQDTSTPGYGGTYGNNQAGIYQDTPGGAGYYVVDASVQLRYGAGFAGAGVLMYGLDANGNLVSTDFLTFAKDPDIGGRVVGYGVTPGTETFRFSKLCRLTGPVATIRIYAMTNWTGFPDGGMTVAKGMSWLKCGYRAASTAEIKTGEIDDLSASVSTQEGVIADLQGKTAAFLQTTVAAGSSSAAVSIVADGQSSGIELQADAIRLGSGKLAAMDVVGGDVIFHGKLTAGSVNKTQLDGSTSAAVLNNLVDSSDWWGSIALPAAPANFVWNNPSSNSWSYPAGPTGAAEAAMLCTSNADSTAVGGGAGGWNLNFTPSMGFSPNKSYRYYTWVYYPSFGQSSIYHGTDNIVKLDGSAYANPYFFSYTKSNFVSGRWYLMVGVVHAAGYTGGPSGQTGLYDPVTGQSIMGGTEYKWRPDATYGVFRSYQYYASANGVQTYFTPPVVEEIVSGKTVSIRSLMQTLDPARQINTGTTTIDGGKITTGSVTTDKMSVSSLSAITGNFGTFSTLDANGNGMVITGNQFVIYENNVAVGWIGKLP